MFKKSSTHLLSKDKRPAIVPVVRVQTASSGSSLLLLVSFSVRELKVVILSIVFPLPSLEVVSDLTLLLLLGHELVSSCCLLDQDNPVVRQM